MTYKPYQIVVVPFPFVDKQANKRRPAVILSSSSFIASHAHLLLAMITTSQKHAWESDVVITDWKTAGFHLPCIIRFKLFTLDTDNVLQTIGSLSQLDQDKVKFSLKNHLAII